MQTQELKKGNRICVWNSVVLFIVSIILMVLCDVGFVGGLGAIIFCYINKCLFVLESEESNTLKKSNSKSNKNKKRGKAKTSFCKYCGGKLDDENKCKKCGKNTLK